MHHFGMRQTDRITQNSDGQGKSLQKAFNTIKSAAENVRPKKVGPSHAIPMQLD